MDEKLIHSSSFQLDQEILDARGINMTVAEVAGLTTIRYSERVQALKLSDADLVFLKCLRRRIKNRLASQNSRRRSMEHLRRLSRELRAVKACKGSAQHERASLLECRTNLVNHCRQLHAHLVATLIDRNDTSELPSIDWIGYKGINRDHTDAKSVECATIKDLETKMPLMLDCFKNDKDMDTEGVFECRLDKLVQNSVHHLLRREQAEPRIVCAKTVFISNQHRVVDHEIADSGVQMIKNGIFEDGVLNLSVKSQTERRRSHGRKQTAPRRIAYVCNEPEDCVLDLKIKRDNQ